VAGAVEAEAGLDWEAEADSGLAAVADGD